MPPATRKTAAATPRKRAVKAVKKATPAPNRYPWDADSFADQAAAEAALIALKAAVVRKVNQLTERHGWCDAATQALTEMRLIRLPKPVTVTVEVEVTEDAMRSMGWETRSDAQVRRLIEQNPQSVLRHSQVKTTTISEPDTPGPAA